METLRGRIARLMVYEEEGRGDFVLSLAKLCLYASCFLFPPSVFRLVKDLFGLWQALMAMVVLALLFRIIGPLTLVMMDEIISRIFPLFRSVWRRGVVRVYDFRIQTLIPENREVSCVLKGNQLIGATPMAGDLVTLEGRMRAGTFHVRRGIIEGTQSLLVPKTIPSGWILLASMAVLGVFIVYLTGAFDESIYSLIEWLLESPQQ
jgi:hypothetical protein